MYSENILDGTQNIMYNYYRDDELNYGYVINFIPC